MTPEVEEPVDPADQLMFLCLGGGNEVGRSCHIIQYKGKTVMVPLLLLLSGDSPLIVRSARCGHAPCLRRHICSPFLRRFRSINRGHPPHKPVRATSFLFPAFEGQNIRSGNQCPRASSITGLDGKHGFLWPRPCLRQTCTCTSRRQWNHVQSCALPLLCRPPIDPKCVKRRSKSELNTGEILPRSST